MQDNHEKKWIAMILIGLWLQFCFIISKSYQGSLTSSLAVKYLPTPFESTQDVINHPGMNIAFETNALMHQFIKVKHVK